jgi:hypothetical protein
MSIIRGRKSVLRVKLSEESCTPPPCTCSQDFCSLIRGRTCDTSTCNGVSYLSTVISTLSMLDFSFVIVEKMWNR